MVARPSCHDRNVCADSQVLVADQLLSKIILYRIHVPAKALFDRQYHYLCYSAAMKTNDIVDETDLLLQLHRGSQTAFDTLFRMFHPALCFFARRLTVSLYPGEAEEIVLDSFLKLWQRRSNFSSLSSVKAFLYIATRNACLNNLDKEEVRHRKHVQYLYSADDVEDTVVEEIIYTEVLREVSYVIESLPAQCRRIIKMAYEEGLTTKEIATALNITVSTVNNQKSRGVRLLKKRLSNNGFAFLLTFL